MRIVSHIASETAPAFIDAEDKWLDNRNEPVVRIGGETFECHFAPECSTETFVVDPRRSLVKPLVEAIAASNTATWQTADFLARLVQDMGCPLENPDTAAQVAFHTMFPPVAAKLLADSWMRVCCFGKPHLDVPRVVNNPFFHSAPDASDARLLEICRHLGATYSVDLASSVPPPETLCREIAMLGHAHDGWSAVDATAGLLLPDVSAMLR